MRLAHTRYIGSVVHTKLVAYHIYVTVCHVKNNTVQREAFEGENFHKLVKNTILQRKLSRILPFTVPKDTTPLNFAEKTFVANTCSHKTANSQKFSPSKFLLYTVFIPFLLVEEHRIRLASLSYFFTSQTVLQLEKLLCDVPVAGSESRKWHV